MVVVSPLSEWLIAFYINPSKLYQMVAKLGYSAKGWKTNNPVSL